MTIGHGNWNGYKNGYKWRPFWCFLVLQECYRDAREASGNAAGMLWSCNGYCTANTAGRQAGPKGVFSRVIAAILPTSNHAQNRDLATMLIALP